MSELAVEALDAAALLVAVLCWGVALSPAAVSVVYTRSVPHPERLRGPNYLRNRNKP